MVDKQTHAPDAPQLNLARKWRSKNFNEIIGQDIPVRMLKNSLYIGQFFPVYLFSGQRGCGKTSTARVFAAAINCEQLPSFRKDPKKIIVPCAVCASCKAMLAGKHPDCIEIDAASYTGVDHVRQIIDAASFLPLLGKKKIYLIDEAHMLSKAAFNAFLKILEEPPASVLFILATTDPERIIETVKSRCFQVIFKPIDKKPLVKHLENICAKEGIAYEKDALTIIAQESEGAARDALNVLEQVRFAHEKITKAAVFDVLGHLDDERLLQLYDALLNKPLVEFAAVYSQVVTDDVSPTFLWQAFIELFRATLACAHNVPFVKFMHMKDRIQECSKEHSVGKCIALMRLFYEYEMLFLKTATPQAFLQMLLFQACQLMRGELKPMFMPEGGTLTEQKKTKHEPVKKKVQPLKVEVKNTDPNHPDVAAWSSFLHKTDTLDDQLVASIFKQGHLLHFESETGQVKALFPHEFSMFEDMVNKTKNQWQPLLDEAFKTTVHFTITYQEQTIAPKKVVASTGGNKRPEIKKNTEPPAARPKSFSKPPMRKSFTKKRSFEKVKTVDVSDKEMWKKTNLVLEFFPGTVTELQGGEDVSL